MANDVRRKGGQAVARSRQDMNHQRSGITAPSCRWDWSDGLRGLVGLVMRMAEDQGPETVERYARVEYPGGGRVTCALSIRMGLDDSPAREPGR